MYFLVKIAAISHISYGENNPSRIAPEMYPYQSFSAIGFQFAHCSSVVLYVLDYTARGSTSIIQTARSGCGHRGAAEIAFRLVEMGGLPRNWVRAAILIVQGDGGALRRYRGNGGIGRNNGRIHRNNLHHNASIGIKIDLRKIYRDFLEFSESQNTPT